MWEKSAQEISTAFDAVSEPKIAECFVTKQQLHSGQTQSPPDTAVRGRKPLAVTSPAVVVTHFRIVSGRNSPRASRCQTNRNKLCLIERDIQETFLILQLLKEIAQGETFLLKSVSATKMGRVWQPRKRSSLEWEVLRLGSQTVLCANSDSAVRS